MRACVRPSIHPSTAFSFRQAAKAKGNELGASTTMECSAKTQEGLKNVFDEAITVALAARRGNDTGKKKKDACFIL